MKRKKKKKIKEIQLGFFLTLKKSWFPKNGSFSEGRERGLLFFLPKHFCPAV